MKLLLEAWTCYVTTRFDHLSMYRKACTGLLSFSAHKIWGDRKIFFGKTYGGHDCRVEAIVEVMRNLIRPVSCVCQVLAFEKLLWVLIALNIIEMSKSSVVCLIDLPEA